MGAIFEPSLLFIHKTDWNNEQTRDNFLELLLCHLEMIDKYDLCNILWSNELESNLFENPNIHPWFQSDLRNSIIVTIYNKFHARQEYRQQHTDACSVEPTFSKISPKTNSHTNFLRLVHTLVDDNEKFYLCVGNENKLLTTKQYIFKSNRNNHLIPNLLNNCSDWFEKIDIINLFYPTNINDFELKLKNAIEIIKNKQFDNKPLLFDFKFTKAFKKDLINADNHRDKILINITKKLISTVNESRNDSKLQDEYIKQKQEYRIRVTGRPSSTRIHYKLNDKGMVIFLRYYDEGKHDDGL